MTTSNQARILRGEGRIKRILAVGATALVASLAMAGPSWAAVNGDGRNLEVDSTRDFVLLENYPKTSLDVSVIRNGVTIGTFTGTPGDDPKGRIDSVLEINHLGGGQFPAGDCWNEPSTPDILPGDKVQVNVPGQAEPDYTFVRDLTFTEDASGTLSGHARGVEGAGGAFDLAAPISVDEAAGRFIEAKRVSAATERVFVTPDANGDFAGVDLPGSGGEVTLQFVNPQAAPDAVESTVSGPVGQGPEATVDCPPLAQNAMTSFSTEKINSANVNTDLTVGGVAQAGISVTVSANGKSYPVTSGNGTWTATIPSADLQAWPEGNVDVTATFAGDGAPTQPQTKTIVKDTVAPAAPTATPGSGVYNSAQSVELEAEPGAEIRYTKQAAPAQPSTIYNGPIAVSSSQTIRAIAIDKAGNPSANASSFDYKIDTVAPLTPGIDLVASSDSGSSNTDNRTNDSTPTFSGHTEPGATVRLFVDGAVRGSAQANANGDYSVTSSALAHGSHNAVAEARDAAGNTSRSATLSVNVDLVKPGLSGRSPAPNAVGRAVGTNVTATFNEPVVGVSGASFTLKRGTVSVPAVVSYNATTRTATLNPNANLARNTLYTAALTGGIRDAAGNTLAPVSWSFRTVR